MKNHEKLLYEALEQIFDRVSNYSSHLIDHENGPVFPDLADGYIEPASVASSFGWLLIGYYSPSFSRYHDKSLLEEALAIVEHFEGFVHEDGSVDMLSTNFHDPAQTAFIIMLNLYTIELLVHFTEHTPLENELYEATVRVLRKMGKAMVNLGFHTANHRWVISSALSVVYKLTGDKTFLDAINGYLKEGIDCDEEGEYTERSTGCYNDICNRSFTCMGHFLDKKFLEYPRRNLKLMQSFIEPDMTVNTLNSSRWDQGGAYNISMYYSYYLIFALIYNDTEFAYIADKIMEKNGADHLLDIPAFCFFLLYPELAKRMETLEPKAPNPDASRFLPNSHIARIYRPEHQMTMTVLRSRCPVFFQMNYGSDILQVRFAGAFFGDPHTQFRPKEIIPIEDGYRLISEEIAGYRSQLEEAPETSDWRHMDHSKRKLINLQTSRTVIDVHLLEDGAAFDITADGCDGLMTKLEFVITAGGKLETDSVFTRVQAGDYLFLKSGKAKYYLSGERYFEIGDGFCAHTYGEKMRGSAPVDKSKVTLAMTAKAPHTVHAEVHAKTIF